MSCFNPNYNHTRPNTYGEPQSCTALVSKENDKVTLPKAHGAIRRFSKQIWRNSAPHFIVKTQNIIEIWSEMWPKNTLVVDFRNVRPDYIGNMGWKKWPPAAHPYSKVHTQLWDVIMVMSVLWNQSKFVSIFTVHDSMDYKLYIYMCVCVCPPWPQHRFYDAP